MRSGIERKARRRERVAEAKRKKDGVYYGAISPWVMSSGMIPPTPPLNVEAIREAVKKLKAASERPYIPF